MTRPWRPEHPVDAALAQRLVAARLPELADHPPVHVGSGWDVDVWQFGAMAVRFPRRTLGARCLDNELVVLPMIGDRVPLPVPRPTQIAEPVLGYRARFYAHPLLPGLPASRANLDDGGLARLAAPLGRFLAALHAAPLPAMRAAGLRDDDRGGVVQVAARGRARLELVADAELRARAAAILDGAVVGDVASSVVHGDLHPGNLLVDDDGTISGVIDWGDCAAGDPAIDLAIGWSLIPRAARGDFIAAYGDLPAATWARARVHAVARHALAILAWARDLDDPAQIAFSEATLRRAVG